MLVNVYMNNHSDARVLISSQGMWHLWIWSWLCATMPCMASRLFTAPQGTSTVSTGMLTVACSIACGVLRRGVLSWGPVLTSAVAVTVHATGQRQ